MSLNSTPSADRIHIGIFGKRNAGKSSVINAITGQSLAIVSDVKGTTTDPVLKAMELLPLGPVVMIDTPGLDDEGELGALRIQKACQILNKTDIAVVVVDGTVGMTKEDDAILDRIKAKDIPYVVVMNKLDLAADGAQNIIGDAANAKMSDQKNVIWVSSENKTNIYELKELIASQVKTDDQSHKIVGDLLEYGDLVVLVVPIDSAAPKGRLILPQQQTIRDVLESGAVSIVVRESELADTLAKLGTKPKMVITDSQAFEQVAKEVPEDILLTSFSILFARYKGNLKSVAEGARCLDKLKDGDTVLISEGCTHHRQCDDIGTVKMPGWIKEHTGKELRFEFSSGVEFPMDLSRYQMIIHCGGCTLNEREMKYRLKCAADQGVPMTNYGTAIAYMKGILERSLEVFAS
ncbi:MAG: [FeFe] hydrogenase H-cluster maturation GTPase HydF [Hespellia sp.]|nr:[FeFe] hydrogenase H-cluster maturation GTPase HydF [Hespellia sp.]